MKKASKKIIMEVEEENELTIEISGKDEKVNEYLSSLNDMQKKAYLIAKEHLGSSFNVNRSNGYHEWNKK
jgi:hypothetical protein